MTLAKRPTAATGGAGCAECATVTTDLAATEPRSPGAAAAAGRVSPLLMIQARGTPTPRGRDRDRWITTASIVIAAAYVMLAGLSLFAPASLRQGWWLPIHLLLAGGATTAIAGVMPFFSASVASVAPAPIVVRIVGVAGIAIGAGLIILVRLTGPAEGGWTAGVAGFTYLVGIGAMAAATLLPFRSALGPRRVILAASYGTALLCVAIGASLGVLALSGWQPILAAWDVSRAAHGWLNVFGFLTLVIGASLIHLLPTVAGCRIERTRTSMTVVGALMIGPMLTAAGFLLRVDLVVMAGSSLVLLGAVALGRHAIDVTRRRARWTTDPEWHRFTLVSLQCAIGWLLAGAALATAKAWAGGATTRGWDLAWWLAPVALGCAAQALVGSWTHLLPSIGPGTPLVHAAQRRILGSLALPRLVAYQAGVGLLTAGIPAGAQPVIGLGLVAVGGCLALAVALLVVAAWRLRDGRSVAVVPLAG